MAALVHRKIKAEDLPQPFLSDRDFLLLAVIQSSLVWLDLPFELKIDIGFAKSITTFTNNSVLDKIIMKIPRIVEERKFWLAVFDKPKSPRFSDSFSYRRVILREFAPPSIHLDHEIMLKACMADPLVFKLLAKTSNDGSLVQDRKFISDLLQRKPEILGIYEDIFSADTMRMFPDLFVKALPQVLHSIGQQDQHPDFGECECDFEDIVERFPDEFWTNRDFIRAWFQSGGPFLGNQEMVSLKDDKEVLLCIAKFDSKDDPQGMVGSFRKASPVLRADATYMLQVIGINPNIYHALPSKIKQTTLSSFWLRTGAFLVIIHTFPNLMIRSAYAKHWASLSLAWKNTCSLMTMCL